MDKKSLARRTIDTAVGNWVSRGYLALVSALLVWVVVDTTLVTHVDASFAGVVPVLFTAPTSFALLVLPGDGIVGYCVVIAAAALVNAAVIGLLVRLVAGPRGAVPLGA